MSATSSTFRPLTYPTFRSFWIVNQISNFGTMVQGVAAGWMMASMTTSPDMVAMVQAASSLPLVFFALTGGALADNSDRRKVMLIAQSGMMIVSALLVAVTWAGLLTPWLLLAFTFAIGIGMAINNPCWQASVGDLVPREEVPEAVSISSMGLNAMRSIGPAVGGVILAAFGSVAAFAVNAVSYLPYMAVLARWSHRQAPSPLSREPLPTALAAGLRYVAMSPNLLRVLLRDMVFGFGAVGVIALLPVIARDMLQGDAFTFGLLLGAFGFGAICGGLANATLRRRFKGERIVEGAFLCFATAALVIGNSAQLVLALPALVLAGGCWVVALSLFNVTVQLSSPRWVVGRALALHQMAVFGGMAGGSRLWGKLADWNGLPLALSISAVVLVGGALIGLRLPLPAFGGQDLSPRDGFNAPDLKLDLRGRSGPIMVMIDYLIDQKDIPAFLACMTERRRIRRRDGARQWVLLRDLEHPEQWTESYHVATWDEYLRHNMRRTKADDENLDTLRSLHKGPDLPRVHRMIERQSVPGDLDLPLKPLPETM